MQPPLVSVVIPGFNCARYVRETLESVLAQTYPRIEIVFVDDGSSDGTRAVLEPFRDRIVYHHQPNRGLAAARNAGMSLAQGDFIAWLDADDRCSKDRLLAQVAFLAVNPDVVAIGSNFSAFDDETGTFDSAHAGRYYAQVRRLGLGGLFPRLTDFDGRDVPWMTSRLPRQVRVYWGDIWRGIVVGNFVHPPTLVMRRTARERAGWVRLGYRTGGDWEYIIALAKLGPMALIDEPLVEYRCHPAQMSGPSRTLEGTLDCIDLVDRLLVDEDVIADQALHRALGAKLAEVHLTAAYVLAEAEPLQAISHLREAWKSPPSRRHVPRQLARVVVPRRVLRLLRRLRGRDPSTSYRRRD